MKTKRRIWELDFLRGFSIILMLFDHLMFDFQSMPYWFSNYDQLNHPLLSWFVRLGTSWWSGDLRPALLSVFIVVFMGVSGISFTFSRSNVKRGLKFLLVAALISAVTMTMEALTGLQLGIVMGIIHMYALATLATVLIRKISSNPIFVGGVGVAIIVLGVLWGWRDYQWVSELRLEYIPGIIIGRIAYGADYFGLVPFLGMILLGTVVGDLFYKSRQSLLPKLDGKWNAFVCWFGQKALWIFVFHQVLFWLLVVGIGLALGYRF